MCVSKSKSLNLGHEIHRDASENKGDMLWETESVLKFDRLPETNIALWSRILSLELEKAQLKYQFYPYIYKPTQLTNLSAPQISLFYMFII